MGKATIVSGGDDGKYSVNLDFGTKVRDAHLQRITTRLAKLQTETAEAQTKLDAQKVIETSKRAAVETAIAEFVAASNTVPRVEANVSKALKAHSDAAKELMKQKGATAKLRLALEMLQDQTAQLKKDDAYWRGLALEETRQVWCADLTEEGEGEVATIEIPGESKLILIAPEAREAKPEDGQLVAREAQTAAQVFFNAAILPGWQKWKPTYRTGRITALDLEKNTAEVDLDDEKSSAQKLDVNQSQALQKVPVIYMGCHAEAFEVGDACVVEFKNAKWESPQVVGFVSNPKACPGGIGIVLSDVNGNPLPGHTGSDDEGVMYRLTPKTSKGNRTSTGQWTARKMSSWSAGGKAVNADSSGRLYFTGVQGRGDSTYPVSFGDYGSVNEHALAVEDRLQLPVYRFGKNIGSSRDDRAPLPFILEWTDGKKYAAQIVPRYFEGQYTTAFFELLVGPLPSAPGNQVGLIVSTVEFPPDTFIPFWRISIHPNGRSARAVSIKQGVVCKLDFDITPTSITYRSSGCKPDGFRQTKKYADLLPGSNTVQTRTGDDSAGSLTVAYTFESNFNDAAIDFVDGDYIEVIRPSQGTTGTGRVETNFNSSCVYAYGPKGESIDIETSSGSEISISNRYEKSQETSTSVWGPGGTYRTIVGNLTESYSYVTTRSSEGSEILGLLGEDAGGVVIKKIDSFFSQSKYVFFPQYEEPQVNLSGGGHYTEITRAPGDIIPVFFDRNVGFAIARIYTEETTTIVNVIGANRVGTATSSTTTPASSCLIVKSRSAGVVMNLPLAVDDSGQFVAYSAADALTGSIVVNLQQRTPATSEDAPSVLASWIFLVDKTGVKTIQDVIPNLPQNVRAQANHLLITA